MGLLSSIKKFFYEEFGIETKEEKEVKAKAKEDSSTPESAHEQKSTSDEQKKEKEDREWKDLTEQVKFVCHGGKVQCPFANPPMADIIVTSSTIMLQDKPWASVKDKDGKVNFNFTGVCTHPSQQKPMSPPPPCKAVISLGEWKDFSDTMIGDNNALLVKSAIPCMISGQDLKIIDSGQKAELSEVKPKMEEPKEKILSIEVLEGDNPTTEAEVIQCVNIKKEAKYVDGTDIKHLDRTGQKLRLKVKFDKPGQFKFKVKLKPEASNVVYTSAEKSRNPNFQFCSDELEFMTNSNGERIIDADKIFVSPAGGDKFTISAKDERGHEVIAVSKIKTKRMMYYIEIKMNGLTTIASSLSLFTNEYNTHNITFKGLSGANIAHMPNIGNTTDSNTFKSRIQTAYTASTGPSKSPYCVIIGYTDHLAVKDASQLVAPVNAIGGSVSPINIPIVKQGSTDKHALWKDIVPGEDWFVECYFIKNGGTVSDRISIDKSKCAPIQSTVYPTGYYDSVDVDISTLPPDNGKIVMKVNWVNRMRGGLSFGGTNIVAICTKAWWQTKNDASQNQVMIHEIGHQFGMVSGGTGLLPDKSPYYYDTSKGHVGNHCHYDIASGQVRYDSSTDFSNSKCVMYGATNGKSTFCVECAKVLKKVDLKNGV